MMAPMQAQVSGCQDVRIDATIPPEPIKDDTMNPTIRSLADVVFARLRADSQGYYL